MKRPGSEVVMTEGGPKPPKAYKNGSFLNSSEARLIRIMCELQEPKQRLDEEGVDNIVMFFGSARAKPKAEYEKALAEAKAKVASAPTNEGATMALNRLQKQAFLQEHFQITIDLASLMTKWSMERVKSGKSGYSVGTGGGPGMMEAANEGAHKAGGKSVGFGISLPFEDHLNKYVTPDLAFEFHYFFTRKFMMAYKCMGLVIAPGGLGTCDELFEILTLRQTGKIKQKLPIVLIGKKFWQHCINWEAFVDYGMISESDTKQLFFTDSAEEAFRYLVDGIEAMEAEPPTSPKKKRESDTVNGC